MKFMTDLLLSILKSIIVTVVLSVIAMSLIQKKFPPSYDDTRDLVKNAKKVFEISAAMKADDTNAEVLTNTNSLITSRQKLYNEMRKLDPTMEDHPIDSATKEQQKMPDLPDLNRRDLLTLNTKLDQAEYKIRILENEMKQLKDEYKKLKSSGAIRTAH